MTITYDPKHTAYLDEHDVRSEMTRVFDVCDGCRRCVTLCSAFPSLFEMLGSNGGDDAAALTPAQQDRVADECFQCRQCRDNCPYVPGRHELAIDFPRLMARAMAVRHLSGQRAVKAIIADQLLGRADVVGKVATRAAPAINRMVGIEPGTFRRRVLAQLAGVTARRRLTPYSRSRFSSSLKCRQRPSPEETVASVTVFPTCLVEYRRPEIGHALVDVYSRNGIACEVAGAGCCGAPWLTAGDTRRFAARASRNVATLAAAIRAGTDIVVAQPTCHAVITTDYIDHVGGSDSQLVARRTFDAVQYLADHLTHRTTDQTPGSDAIGRLGDFGPGVDATVVHHEPCPRFGDDSPSPARRLLEMTGSTVEDVRLCTGVDGRWGLRTSNERIGLAIANAVGADIERSAAEVVSGSCVLTNTAIAQETGRVAIHPFELLAAAYDRADRRGADGDPA